MKRLSLIIALLALPILGFGDDITLDEGEVLSTPTATKISDWEIIRINAANQNMRVRYRWRDSGDGLINMGNRSGGWNYWSCRNRSEGDNAQCIDVDDPWDCCTGSTTGTCPEVLDSCFSDVFNFQIREQDVDTSIGIGLRTLIWNQMKQDVLTGVNDGDFD